MPIHRLTQTLIGFYLQLVTGKMPFPNATDYNVTVMISRGKRPQKPSRFDAPGISSAVWKVAKKCWDEKAKDRPEVHEVLQRLEKISNPGVCTHKACTCSDWEVIDYQSE